jgi:catechol 2,3-dioxygenase-like lactoylglutathione lyase family enzyme
MPRVTPLKRTSIFVRDMEKSLAFYRDVLGMRVWMEGGANDDLPAIYQLLGMPPCRTRWAILQSGEADWGMVGLFELTDPAPVDDTHPSIDRVNRGETCLVFHTRAVQELHARAQSMGLTILCPPMRVAFAAHGLESSDMTLRDPNGVLLHFTEVVRGGAIRLSNDYVTSHRRKRKLSKVKPNPAVRLSRRRH